VAFFCKDAAKRSIHIVVGALWKFENEPTFNDSLNFFLAYTEKHKYTQVTHGRIRFQNREFFWGQYLMPQGVIVRKYSVTVNRVEYIITCQYGLSATATEKDSRRAERDYDDILSTFRITGTATPESLTNPSRYDGEEFIKKRPGLIFRVIVVCLLSALWILVAWMGWQKEQLLIAPWLTWVWTIAGGLIGSQIVYQDSRDAGAPGIVANLLRLAVLIGWASIIFALGLL